MSQEQPSTVLTTPPPISKDDDALLNSKPAKIWNTQKLGLRLGTDVVSAAIAAGSVAPVICLIDQYVFVRTLFDFRETHTGLDPSFVNWRRELQS